MGTVGRGESMTLKLRPIASNMTEVDLANGDTVLFSYSTPVAARTAGGLIRTNQFWSVTTSRHINKWCGGKDRGKLVDQSVLDEMV